MKEFPLSEVEPRFIAMEAVTKRWSSNLNTLNPPKLSETEKKNLKSMVKHYSPKKPRSRK